MKISNLRLRAYQIGLAVLLLVDVTAWSMVLLTPLMVALALLVVAMGGHYFIRDGELIHEMAASKDKEFLVIEGAVHVVRRRQHRAVHPEHAEAPVVIRVRQRVGVVAESSILPTRCRRTASRLPRGSGLPVPHARRRHGLDLPEEILGGESSLA